MNNSTYFGQEGGLYVKFILATHFFGGGKNCQEYEPIYVKVTLQVELCM